MPRKKKFYKKRRRYKKRDNAVVGLSNASPLARTLKVVMPYVDQFTLTSGGSSIAADYVFTLTGMYDPNYTNTGGRNAQPRGFDEFIGVLYDHYVVIGVKAEVTFINNSTTVMSYAWVGVRDSNTTINDQYDWREAGFSKQAVLGVEGSSNVKTIRVNINPAKFLGRSNPLSDPHLKGSSSTNPTEQCWLHCGAMNTDGTACNVTAQVKLDYMAILIEPRDPGAS